MSIRTIGAALACALVLVVASVAPVAAQDRTLFVEPTDQGFETYLAAAIHKKKVAVTVVEDRDRAVYLLKAAKVETEVVTTGKKVINCLFASCSGNENKAAVSVTLVKDGAIVWSYAVNKGRGAKNLQSMAEAIAKHLNDEYIKKLPPAAAAKP